VTVAVFDRDTQGGYPLKGDAEGVSDHRLVLEAEVKLKEFGIDLKPKKIWTVRVNEIYSLEPNAKSKYPFGSSYYT
jgi:hypothetical protein